MGGIYSSRTILLTATIIFLGTIVSPPALMDDVDSSYAQIARTMLESGDWVTARLDGVVYFDKPPGQVWAVASAFAIFGVHDWAARIPMALAAIGLCWVTFRFGQWAFGRESGFWAGMTLATSVGMWLFSRVRIPDPALTLTITLSLYAAMKLLEDDAARPRLWAAGMGAALGAGMLLKGLPGIVFPSAALGLYLLVSRRLADWRRLRLGLVAGFAFILAAPWHVLAVLRNPPYFDLSMTSEPGVYRGFFWRYFINEHVLRYLGLRFPRDYDTVPQGFYWLGHLLWLFPGSAMIPAALRLPYAPTDRSGRVRLLCLCWLGFVLLFFALSTRQEYYTMSAYPAMALLLGDAAERGGAWVRRGARLIGVLAAAALAAVVGLLALSWNVEPNGDIAQSLSANPDAYRLALGHMQDLTIQSFAWLRGPLLLAAAAFGVGLISAIRCSPHRALIGAAMMMALLFQAARWAMVSFDPYLSSQVLAAAYDKESILVLDDQYYAFSSVIFYTNAPALLLNGRVNNIEYGSNAPDAPDVFLDDESFQKLWASGNAVSLATFEESLPRFESLLGRGSLHVQVRSGGKVLLKNRP